MKPLDIDISQYGTGEEVLDNLRYNLARDLQEFEPSLCIHDGTCLIIGSGPSLKHKAQHIAHQKKCIIAVNGGHDFLVKNGTIPDLFLTCDPRGMPENFNHINEKTIYLLSSRCAPSDVDLVLSQTKNVVTWHSGGAEKENEILGDRMAVGGGTTSGLRAINMAYLMGFRKVILYGMDSCLDDNKAKRYNSGPLKKETLVVDVKVGDKTFWCNGAMAQQAQDFQSIWDIMPDLHVEVVGGGLLAAIIEERKQEGLIT